MKRNLFFLGLLFLLCIPLIIPYLKTGYPETHDGLWAVIRLSEMHREIKDGQFPARWSGFLNHGYGYPLFLFAYPLPFYIGEIFHLIGFGVINSTRILFILSVFFSGVAMFLFVRKIWNDWTGLLASALYLYAPYRMVNMFIRGSVGELWAFGFFPLLFWLFHKLSQKFSIKLSIICGLVLGLFILNHNASAFLFLPFLLSYLIYLLFSQKRQLQTLIIKNYLISIILGVMISAFFWLPMVVEKKYIALSVFPLSDQLSFFVPVNVLLGFGNHLVDNMPLHLGLIHLLLVVFGIILTLFFLRKDKKIILFFTFLLLISIFLAMPISKIFWQLPFYKDMDFPYRILGISSFFLAIIGSSFIFNKFGKFLVIFLILIVVLLNLKYIKVDNWNFEKNSYFESNDATTTSNDELMPIWVKDKPKNRPDQKIILSQGEFQILQDTSNNLDILTTSEQPAIMTVNTVYFPGWKVLVNNQPVPIDIVSNIGLIEFNIPAGKDILVKLRFEKTPVRQIADIISITGLFLGVYLWIFSKKYS